MPYLIFKVLIAVAALIVIVVAICEGALTGKSIMKVLKAICRVLAMVGFILYQITRKIAFEVFCVGVGIAELLRRWAKAYEESAG